MIHLIDTATFFAGHYAVLAAFLFFSFLWGGIIVDSLFPGYKGEKIFLYTSLGLGLLIVFLFYSALFSMLYNTVIVCFLLLPLLYYIYSRNYSIVIPNYNHNWHVPMVIGLVVSSMILLPILLLPLYPPLMWDEISYHLPYARVYSQSHSLEVNQFLRFPLYSHNFDLLYSLSLLFFDDILAHLFHAAAAILTAAGIYFLGKETYSRSAGILAASFFMSSQVVYKMMGTSYIDLGLALFVFLTFYCLVRWLQQCNENWLYLAGFATGVAAGTKYSGLFFVLLFTIWVILDARQIRPMLKFLIPAVFFGSPWYIRNAIISGDPFSPFGGETFGYWVWNKSDLIHQGKDLMVKHGTPRNFLSLLKFPTNVVFHPELFDFSISPGILGLFPSVLMFKMLPSLYRKVALFVFINVIVWFFGTQIVRYLLPVLPMIFLLSAVAIMLFYEHVIEKPLARFFQQGRSSFIVFKTITYIPIACAITYFVYIDLQISKQLLQNPIPITKAQRYEFLAKRLPAFELLQYASKWPTQKIYQLGFEDSFYYAKGQMIGDWFGPARYSNIIEVLSDPPKLHEKLVAQQAQLFLFNKKRDFMFNYGPNYYPYLEKIAETSEGQLFIVKNHKHNL